MLKKAFLLFILLSSLTACVYIESEGPRVNRAADFTTAIENQKINTAWSMLSSRARAKIRPNQLLSQQGDFYSIVNAFKEAGLGSKSTREIKFGGLNYQGHRAVLAFMLVQEHGDWKIDNVSVDNPD